MASRRTPVIAIVLILPDVFPYAGVIDFEIVAG